MSEYKCMFLPVSCITDTVFASDFFFHTVDGCECPSWQVIRFAYENMNSVETCGNGLMEESERKLIIVVLSFFCWFIARPNLDWNL